MNHVNDEEWAGACMAQSYETAVAVVRVGRLEIRPVEGSYGHHVFLDGVEVQCVTKLSLEMAAGEPARFQLDVRLEQ